MCWQPGDLGGPSTVLPRVLGDNDEPWLFGTRFEAGPNLSVIVVLSLYAGSPAKSY